MCEAAVAGKRQLLVVQRGNRQTPTLRTTFRRLEQTQHGWISQNITTSRSISRPRCEGKISLSNCELNWREFSKLGDEEHLSVEEQR